jgi:hypothetical protein
VWNTTAGGSSTPATAGSGIGQYYPTEMPLYVCDNNVTDRYTSFGPCTVGNNSAVCGLSTGFYRIPLRGASLITGLQVCTGSSSTARDPITITFEGSNQAASSLTLGSSWTLLYAGPSGLATDPGRQVCGPAQSFSNSIWYNSYRFLVTSKRGNNSAALYSEVRLIGY